MNQQTKTKRIITFFSSFVLAIVCLNAWTKASYVQTPYKPQKAVFDFYFDQPEKLYAALFWLRSFVKPLSDHPYNYPVEAHKIVVIIHGRELVVLAKKNYKKYKSTIDRMRYYVERGVKFKVCGIAMADFGYKLADLQPFVEVVPSAIVELAHWQSKGYALIVPKILFKTKSNHDIR